MSRIMSEVRVVDLKEFGVSKEVFDKIYSMGEQDGREDAIKETISYMQEYGMIDCNCCTENNRCDRDCWDVIAEQLK